MRPRPTPAPRPGLALPLALLLAAALSAGPAAAGFLDDLLGHADRVPSDPFASNLASAPPSPADAARARRAERDRRGGRPVEAGRDASPLPPGRIPE